MQGRRVVLGPVLVAYLAAALAYALLTPLWQAPDEPAHFNYVRHLVEESRLPILQPGDYPGERLDELRAAHWPDGEDVSDIRYEGHQPPLYYLLATPILGVVRGESLALQVWALRLFTVALGAVAVFLTHRLGLLLWPGRHGQATALAAFTAFLPMHTAIAGAVNNDVLAEALLIATVIVLSRAIRRPTRGFPARWLALGTLLGLCLLTKTTAYIAVPLAAVGLLLMRWTNGVPWARLARCAGLAALPAAVLWLPWIVRNLVAYGPSDPLGLARHDAVVAGQLTTAERLAQVGLGCHLLDAAQTGFRSFWGVFGWMGVPMHEQVYLLLAAATVVALLGLGAALARDREAATTAAAHGQAWLLIAWGLFSFLGVLWYNMKYVQFQGRYLFGALAVWGGVLVLGWSPPGRHPLPAAAGLILWAAAAATAGAVQGDVPGVTVALLLATAAAVVAWAWASRRVRLAAGIPLAALWALNLAGALYYVQRFL